MPDFDHLAEMVDRVSLSIENDTLRVILGWLRPIELRLIEETRVARRALGDVDDLSDALRQARAQTLLAQVRTIIPQLEVGPDSGIPASFIEQQRRSYEAGIETARRTLDAYAAELPGDLTSFAPRVDLDRLTSLATASTERLHRHSLDTIERVGRILSEQMSRGTGVGRITELLRAETNLLRYQAERIVRTEAMSTSDDARRDTFGRNGIDYVQRVATNDARVCPVCAYRDGRVYRLSDRPTAMLHPNDRCVLVPWRPDWPDAVRGDSEHRTRRRQAITAARRRDPDFEPDDGPAPFETMNGTSEPTPVWTP